MQSGGILIPTGLSGSVITGGQLSSQEYLLHTYGPLTINSALDPIGSLTKTGPANLTLGLPNNNNLTQPIVIHQGNLVVNTAGANTFSGPISSSGTLTKLGGGALTLAGATNLGQGRLVVNGGTRSQAALGLSEIVRVRMVPSRSAAGRVTRLGI